MVIPANVNHLNLEPMAIGIAVALQDQREHRQQPVTSDVAGELEKLALLRSSTAPTR